MSTTLSQRSIESKGGSFTDISFVSGSIDPLWHKGTGEKRNFDKQKHKTLPLEL